MRFYRGGIVVFSLLFLALGIALIAVTAVRGGGAGYVFGLLFLALGAGRLYLLFRG
jgi:NADH:ubiquinone oxidoreductase subunit K